MHPGRNGRGRRRARDAGGFVVTGFAAVFTSVSFLLTVLVAGTGHDSGAGGSGAVLSPDAQRQVILAFAVMSAGLLLIMYGMRGALDARPPIYVRRVVDAAAAVLWNGGGPERLLPVLIILMWGVLEAWFDFF